MIYFANGVQLGHLGWNDDDFFFKKIPNSVLVDLLRQTFRLFRDPLVGLKPIFKIFHIFIDSRKGG